MRERTAEAALWTELLLIGIILGATVYQRISLIPEWGGALPGSLIAYFKGTRAAASIGRFWICVLPPTALVMIVTVIANWPFRARRRWIGIAAAFFFAMLIWTEVYFVPHGVIPLMVHAGAGLSPDEITRMANAWIFWDWFRLAGTIATFFTLVKAVTFPTSRG
jgi:glycerol-3-phosphate acyltransferase PlsY